MSGHQLDQRIKVSTLDWSAVAADPRAKALWGRREALLAELRHVPLVLSHGDVHPGNLRSHRGDVVLFDWGTLGLAPVGSDLAYLALDTRQDLLPRYLDGLDGAFTEREVGLAYRATLVLSGASRVHWMLSAGIEVPDGYVDFVWEHRN